MNRRLTLGLLLSTAIFSLPLSAQPGQGFNRFSWNQGLDDLQAKGAWDTVIAETTKQLAANPDQPPAYLLYQRASAAFTLGRLDMAEADLKRIQSLGSRPEPAVAILLDRVQKMRAAVGNGVREIKSGDMVLFRVSYEVETPWASAIIAALPKAYEANKAFYGLEATETPVFIFSSPQKYQDFRRAQYGNVTLLSSQWASGGRAGMCFSPERLSRGEAPDTDSNLFKTTIAHEFNHVLVARQLGTREIPMWLFEGLAQQVEASLDSSLISGWNRRLTRVANANTLVPPRRLETPEDWTKSAEESYRATRLIQVGPDPYAQSWHMTSTLLKEMGSKPVSGLLNDLRDNPDLDAVLKKNIGQDKEAFYAEYLGLAKRMARN